MSRWLRVALVTIVVGLMMAWQAQKAFAHDGHEHPESGEVGEVEEVGGADEESEHAKGDGYWAELAQDYPAWEPPGRVANPAPQDRDLYGEWGPVVNWPHIPVSAAVLPDGRVLSWSSNRRDGFPGGQPEFTYTATWNPITSQFSEIDYTGHDMFCAAIVMDEAGNVIANGGRNTVVMTSRFDFTTSQWVPMENMNDPRWYPTSVAMPDGSIFTASGSGGPNSAELYTPGSGWSFLTGIDWSSIANANGFESHWWPYLHLRSDGTLFHSGPTPTMHIVDTSGSGSLSVIGPRMPSNDWFPKHSAAVMYAPGKVLITGGANTYSGGTTNRSLTVDIEANPPVVTEIAPMANARRFQNAVPLPNGEVIVIGGNTSGIKFNDDGTILEPEIWNPDTNQWRPMADMAVPRNYHSIALMLPDARILSAGGGLCGGCAANHQDGQVYSPPYLFNADGSPATRPVISTAPAEVRAGQDYSVSATPNLQHFSLIKMSSTTHGVNTDVRYLPVSFTETSSGQYQLTSESNINVMTPGYYMLFGLNAQGTPSEAAIVQVTTTGAPSIINPGDQISGVDQAVTLQISASDPTNDPLTYSATGLPTGLNINPTTGQISGAASVAGDFNVTVTAADAFGGVSTSFVWSVVDGPVLISADFSTSASPFTYADDLFRNTNQPSYASGSYQSSTDDLRVLLGGIDGNDILNMSGGWQTTFNLAYDQDVTISLDYLLSTPTAYEPDEYSDILLSVDGTLYGSGGNDYIIRIADGGNSGWQTFQVTLSNLSAGNHTLAVGTFNNKKTESLEQTTARFDNIFAYGSPEPNVPPVVSNPGSQTNDQGDTVSLQINATDGNGDDLTYSASGLPADLSIDTDSGLIAGTLTSASVGSTAVTVTADDGNGGSDSVNFNWTVNAPPIIIDPIISPPQPTNTSINYSAVANGGGTLTYQWDFGDGTPPVGPSSNPSVSHSFSDAGSYNVTLTVFGSGGQQVSMQFVQAIHEPHTANPPSNSTSIVYQERTGNDRVWNVNPDNNTVSVFNVVTNNKIDEISVGNDPRSLAFAPDGRLWVVNKDSASISVIDTSTRTVVNTINLPYASQPFGLVFDAAGANGFVVLEATGDILKLHPTTGATLDTVNAGADVRHISVTGDGSTLYVSRFVSPPVPGEETANPQVLNAGGEIVAISTSGMTIADTILLQHSNAPDTAVSGRGIPNYVGPAVISPDGLSAWVASKQDNILRGTLRDGNPLDHDNTVRAITSRIDLGLGNEILSARIDHDDASVANTAAFGPYGVYLFTALEANRQIVVSNVYDGFEMFPINVGRAPQGIALSADGNTLFVHNFMDRSIIVLDISNLINAGGSSVPTIATYDAVATETLASDVLLGKQHFYDAQDDRLALESYLSCATCHNDGGQDGRVWDFTNFGEGLRNTISLEGHAGTGQGPLHWTGNFDEVHDFEGQIRNFALGLGLMSDAAYFAGTRSEPLGDPKAGISSDLDALDAYVSSLTVFANSPYRNSNGTLTTAGVAGQAVFEAEGCVACHSGAGFTDSALNHFNDIGTLTAASGSRLGQPLTGLDTPTLRGLWQTAPYLHDGSAETLADAVDAHNGVSLTAAERSSLVAFLQQLDDNQPALSNSAPTITHPGNQTGTVNDTVDLQLSASDPDGNTLDWTISGLPPTLSHNGSGRIQGTLTAAGVYNVVVTVDDGVGASDSISFSWSVNDDTPPPTCNTNGLLYEEWTGIPGLAVADLTSHPDYPNSPSGSSFINNFEIPVDVNNDYGVRLRGWILVPQSADYTFWISSDDNGELWLSSDDTEGNVSLIANVPSWTNSEEWDKYPEQRSAPISLIGGQRYYVEALMKEWSGGDNLAIAWEYAGNARAVIQQANLCAFELTGNPPTAAASGNPTSGVVPLTVNFDGTGSFDSDGTIVSYDWQFGDGTTASGSTVSHNYTFAGIYTAQLTVTDNDGRSDTATVSISAELDNPSCPTPGVLHEQWEGITGVAISDLTSSPNYPDSPDYTGTVSDFAIPTNVLDTYGVRLRAWVTAPATGDYTFWIASDDNGSLLLSTNDDPINASEIARVDSWTPELQFDQFPEQQSAPISLVAGEQYYIEALMKEWGGGDNLAVAWQLPGGSRQVIPSIVLCPYSENGNPPTAAMTATPLNGDAPLPVSFDGSGSADSDGTIVSYAWDFGDGSTGSGVTINHTYNAAGTYLATLTVTDNDGRSAQDSATIFVTNPGGGVACNTNGLAFETWLNEYSGSIDEFFFSGGGLRTPDTTGVYSDFVVPSNVGDGYRTRLRGYIVPPETGAYTFWVASDNEGQLWLSTDINPSNAVEIAQTWWSPEQDWDYGSSQQSVSINLIAGENYYIEGLHAASWGGDYFAVAWQPPSGAREVIPQSALCVYEGSGRAVNSRAVNSDVPVLSLSPIVTNFPLRLYDDVGLVLTANQQLREDALGLSSWFEALLWENGVISAEFAQQFDTLWQRFYAEASPDLRAWMDSQSDTYQSVNNYIGMDAQTAWEQVNNQVIPTNVTLSQHSTIGTPFALIITLLLTLAATSTILRLRRRR